MKDIIRLLPLIVFPYAYLILLIMAVYTPDVLEIGNGKMIAAIVIAYLIVTLASTIGGSIYAAKSSMPPLTAAKLNFIVKAAQIPAYIFHFLLGLVGTVMSVWGIGFILFAVVIDLVTITLTGIHAIGCVVKVRRNGAVSLKAAVFAGICSFIYCIDLAAAFIIFKEIKNSKNM